MAKVAQEAVNNTRKATDYLYRTREEMRDELQKGMEVVKEDIQRITDEFRDEVSKLTVAAATVTKGTTRALAWCQDASLGHATYSKALNRQLPAAHLSMLTRMLINERQVLIDKDPSAETNQLSDLTECELVAKANEALMHMATMLLHGLANPKAVGTKHL